MRNKYITGVAMLIIIGLVTFKLYRNKQVINDNSKVEKKENAAQIPVIVEIVSLYSPSSALKKTGNVVPFKQAVAYASSPGNITQLNFDLGKQVSVGQVLAITDGQKINIDLQNAIAKENKAKTELDTYIELLEGKAATREKVNQLKLDYTEAKSQVAILQRQIADTRILSPISGIVTEKKVEQGVFVTGGSEIATIIDVKSVKVHVFLTEEEASQVKQNDIVNITSEVFRDKIFNGKVSFISPQGDATHSYLTEIVVNNVGDNPLRSGAFVYVDFNRKNINLVLVVSRGALLENYPTPTVYIVNGNKVAKREIRIGNDFGDKVEIISGLSEGEAVVVSGQINLTDGTEVKITNHKSSK